MSQIKLVPDQLREQSNTYGSSATQIHEILERLVRLQAEMGGSWEGAAWKKFDEQFYDLRPKVNEFAELLQNIDKQLKEVARIIEQTDQEIASKLGFK
ncbi:ESAT-6-like protein [Erysipelotrichaceae bacterium]|nr:ESAT-6-like protein [Erysipelotrichaceae bacterium]